MGSDGNLSIHNSDGDAIWQSYTAGNDGAYLVMQNDGNLVIYDVDNTPLWSTGSHSG